MQLKKEDALPIFMMCAISVGILSSLTIGMVLNKIEFIVVALLFSPLWIFWLIHDITILIHADEKVKTADA